MASYDLEILHQHILQILLTVDRVCIEHNVKYYCWAGTMLGAVRHKGFIPWDDDMDICMPRPDYDLFMTHASEWLPKPLEALSIGAQIIISNASCLPEIYGTSAHYIDPHHPSDDLDSVLNERVDTPEAVLEKYRWCNISNALRSVLDHL